MFKKRNIYLIIIICYFLFVELSNANPSNIITINPNDNIQEIINSIKPNSTLYFTKGMYNQSFTISKPLTLTSHHPCNEVILNVTTDNNKPAITIKDCGVHISNVTIQNNGPGLYTTGIRILNGNSLIHSCNFINTPIGISILSNSNTIENCTFQNCSDEGIVLLSTSFSTANNNIIMNCLFEQNCDAIELQQSSYNHFKNCIIKNNYHSGIDAIKNNNNNNIIQNCTIHNNSVHGIYITHSKNITIQNCSFHNNSDGDIVTPYSSNIRIKHLTKRNKLIITQYKAKKIMDQILSETSKNKIFYDNNQKFLNIIQTILISIKTIKSSDKIVDQI
jgi:parallel beta-helix repeat protein